MIAFTYIISGFLLAGTGFLFARDLITAQTQTPCWMFIFFLHRRRRARPFSR